MPLSFATAPPRAAVRVRHVGMVIQRFRPAFGGQGVQMEQLCRALARRGVRSTIFTHSGGIPPGVEVCDGYSVRRLPGALLPSERARRRPSMPAFALRVLGSLWRHGGGIELLHVHGLTDALHAAWLYGRARRLPVILEMTLLGEDDPSSVRAKRQRLQWLRWRIYRSCDAYVAMSGAFLEPYRREGLPQSRWSLIPQGVDLERFLPANEGERTTLRSRLGLPTDGPLLVFVGSLVERKGIDLLLRAWAEVHDARPDASLVLVGLEPDAGGQEGRALREGLAALPASAAARIVRAGLREDPELWLRAADLFVFPSRREGFGSVIIEAMASGLPCVVARLPGITEMIFAAPEGPDGAAPGPTCDGIVVPQEDAGALAAAALRLLAHPREARAVGARAHRRARERFDIERIADAYLRLYASLLHEGGAR